MLQRFIDNRAVNGSDKIAVKSAWGGGEIQVGELFVTLLESWRIILGAILLFTLAAALYIYFAKPVYRAETLLQVERKTQGIGALSDLSNFFKEESAIVSEFQIIKSRMVLGDVVRRLGMDIEVRSRQLFDSHAVVQIDTFNLPERLLGKSFTLVVVEQGNYQLLDRKGGKILEGRVGELAYVPVSGGAVELFVSRIDGEVGDEFRIRKNHLLDVVKKLRRDLRVEEMGKDSGIVRISIEGTDAQRITQLVNSIANVYVRQNVERRSAEAEKTLAFLNEQLPILKDQMEESEAVLNNYRMRRGTINLPLETQSLLQQSVALEAKLSELATSREELLLRFRPQHPRIAALDAQIGALKRELDDVDKRAQTLPGTQQELLRLSRNAQVSTSLYTTLLNKAQELKVVKAGTVGNVRIIDTALKPYVPVKPVKGLILLLAALLGTLVGVIISVLRKRLHGGVEDPEQIEHLGLPVYATVPDSRVQAELNHRICQGKGGPAVLALNEPDDLSIESLRSLRTSLHFAQLDAKNNIIMITGPSPGVGKSFVSANLAVILARSGKRVLLVDGDLRRGRLHTMFGIGRIGGLSEIIAGDLAIEDAIHESGVADLDLVPTGALPPNPSELLLHENFSVALEQVAPFYDYILIDSPPVLAVNDAAIIGRLAGASLLVLKDGRHPLREVGQCLKALRHAGVNLRGAVFNQMSRLSSRFGYGRYYGYRYDYRK